MARINIYKASAGSGKTWRLSVEFIKLLIKNPESYRHILAVTFTNKATTEMKERILNYLQLLSTPRIEKENPVLRTLEQETGLSRLTIATRAEQALSLLLHDYSRFRVETIDSFFQSILRNLARELGLGTSMNIELEKDEILEEAVDLMIEKAGENKELLEWIQAYIEENLIEGRDRRVAPALKKFGETIFSESFQSREKELYQVLSDKSFLNDYRKELNKLKTQAGEKLKKMGQRFFDLVGQHGLSMEDFSYSDSGVVGYFHKLLNESFKTDILKPRVQQALIDPEKWVTAKHPRRTEIINLAEKILIPYLQECEAERPKLYSIYYSCDLSLKHIYKIGLLTDIALEVRAINREQNRFLLSDTAILLKTLLSDSDTSFVYEKAGTELQHIMIDEFQDTSHIQWSNFKPLIFEGLSKAYDSLLVGDEKQAIYRWRNSDWRILGNLERELAGTDLQFNALNSNFRSEQRIVQFNNALFKQASLLATDSLEQKLGIDCPDLALAYKEIEQQCPRTEEKGWVKALFVRDNENYYRHSLEQVVKQVEYLQEQGIKPDQICILIRQNKHIPEIATYFAQHQMDHPDSPFCYTIVSDEAFRLDASPAVQLLIAALKILANPDDKLAKEELRQCRSKLFNAYNQEAFEEELPTSFESQLNGLIHIPLFELADLLIRLFDLDKIPAQESYLFSFMDKLQEFLEKNTSDLSSFLRYWEEHLSSTNLPRASSMNGIRIISIHKAKGLQYHSVIAAFCDWSTKGDQRNLLWCHTNLQPFSALPLIPVNFQKLMNDTIFREEYQDECIQQFVDNLNLLYVAFTRAEKNLIICSKAPKPEKKGPGKDQEIKTVAQLIYKVLSDQTHHLFSSCFKAKDIVENEPNFDDEDEITDNAEDTAENAEVAGFEYGSICTDSKEDKDLRTEQDFAVEYRSFARKTGFRQSNPSRDFVLGGSRGEFHNSYIDRGKLLHKLFSRIKKKTDAPVAVRSLVAEGLIGEEEQNELLRYTQAALEHPQAKEWYSGNYRLYNECIILYEDAQHKLREKRPDRVIRQQDRMIVIDFKFGKAMSKYRKQVAQYMQLLHQMGHKKVEGYLWYVDDQQVEQVDAGEVML
ncbi:MAG: UvrD-helicase domain-containing protein [Bacteroidales bacterium]|nr:UvrD-helicase domain-containing protein [Bacteroidales bacterium]MDD4361181.1 UvrD-helicase domain-containing protein [Bacteroidales bacterium]MDD4429809.1 UvrD-helicase domain-containing protein [Bacteroidales bacterium]